MATYYISTDATVKLADLVARVERGETVVITRDGKPVAQIVAVASQTTNPPR